MLSLELLPAAHGDSILIEYGSSKQPNRILIDGGPAHAYEAGLRRRLDLLPPKKREVELMVVTHIDADHIDGALILLQDQGLNLRYKEFWFNGWEQLAKFKGDTYAPLQGEFLGGLIKNDPHLLTVWNQQFKKGPVVVPDNKPLPTYTLEGGARITLLGPDDSALRRLRARWKSAIRDFEPGDAAEALRRLKDRREYRPPTTPAVYAARQYGADRSPANGSSISFVLEYEGVSLLLLGDAHAHTLAASLQRLATQRAVERLSFDAIKLPHHGSMGNVSAAWLRLVETKRWLISTNGAVFNHPDTETALLIADQAPNGKKPTIYCNYENEITARLKNHPESTRWITIYPKSRTQGPVGGLLLQWPDAIPPTASVTRPKKGMTEAKGRKPSRKGRGGTT